MEIGVIITITTIKISKDKITMETFKTTATQISEEIIGAEIITSRIEWSSGLDDQYIIPDVAGSNPLTALWFVWPANPDA